MDFFSLEYKQLFRYAEIQISKLPNTLNYVKAEDLINDAYLYIHDNGIEIENINKIKNIINLMLKGYKKYVGINEWATKNLKVQTCKKCNDLKPIYSFRITEHNDKYFYTETVCKKCENELAAKWQRENKEKQKAIQKKFYDFNKELIMKRVAVWVEKEKSILSDKYIRRVLLQSKKYKPADIDANPQLIIDKRNYLIQKNKKQ